MKKIRGLFGATLVVLVAEAFARHILFSGVSLVANLGAPALAVFEVKTRPGSEDAVYDCICLMQDDKDAQVPLPQYVDKPIRDYDQHVLTIKAHDPDEVTVRHLGTRLGLLLDVVGVELPTMFGATKWITATELAARARIMEESFDFAAAD